MRKWLVSLMKFCTFFVLCIMYSASCMVFPKHLQNFDDAKTELRTALGQKPNSGPLSIITVTRSPVDPIGTTELISHNEFEQVLKLLYPLCSGNHAPVYREMPFPNIPFLSSIPLVDRFRSLLWKDCWNALRVPMNLAQNAQLPVRHEHIYVVNNFCDDYKYFHDKYLHDACNIVVFNEMFFSQGNPLTFDQKDFINEKILMLSKSSRCSLFYPNFLYTENRNLSGANILASFNTMNGHVWNSVTNSNGIMNITRSPLCVNDCEYELKTTRRILADATMHNQQFLVNETYGINAGSIVTTYRKATYWNESNDTIATGALYDFGTGLDQTVGVNDTLSKAMRTNISTEICFDLANGIRSKNHWDNGLGQSRLHLLQSNCIDPFDTSGNINNLPIDVPIIYSDSYIDYHRDGLPFCTQILQNPRERHGEYPYRLQEVRIGDSIYTISVYFR